MRLQKYMMLCGVGSRRKCETYIEQGLVRVNGEIVTELGTKVDPETDTVMYKDEQLIFEETVTIVLYKPHGYMCTNEDPEGRKTVQDLIRDIPVRMYHVGRLDYNTEGLLIMSNDGELANILMHPRFEIQKRYTVWCEGYILDQKIDDLRSGVMLEDGMTAPAKVHIKKRTDRETCLQLTIHEGRNRQVRRMIDAVGHSVFRLRRDRIGNIDLLGLNAGNWRYLSDEEVHSLKMV